MKRYLQDHFHWKLYLAAAIFLSLSTYLNRLYGFEDELIDPHFKTLWHWYYMSLFMALPFLLICVLLHLFKINTTWWRSSEFWLLFVFGFVLLGFNRSFYLHYYLIEGLNPIDFEFARKLIWRGKSLFTIFIPLMLFYYYYERQYDSEKNWYGLRLNQNEFKPYAILLVVVVVAMGLASFWSDLTDYYPRYVTTGGSAFARHHSISPWIPMLTYESVYGFNFLNVELFFRGFLVLGFARVLGGQAVLAMVGSYVFLHYGKPTTEAITSAFGGYFIGILTFYSRRIWGGVVLHIALAWSMEFFAWCQRVYGNF